MNARHDVWELRRIMLFLLILQGAFIGQTANGAQAEETYKMPAKSLSETISQTGYLSFYLHTGTTWRDGAKARRLDQTLVRLPGLADCRLTCTAESVNLIFEWGKQKYNRGFLVNLTHLPGPQTYFVQFTWDGTKGRCDGYLNGSPLNLPKTRYKAWKIEGRAKQYVLGLGPIRVSNVHIQRSYFSPKAIGALVPAKLRGKEKALLGYFTPPDSIDLKGRKGKLLYASKLNGRDDLAKWIMEGPGKMSFRRGGMTLQTAAAGTFHGPGHFVLWCPETFPDRFIAQWQFKAISRTGLAIVFFAARGANGQDIFNPDLPRRDGIFSQYTHGAIVSYHFSYFANLPLFQSGRPSSNLRKNNHFYLTAVGPVAVAPGAREFQKLEIIKDGRHIELIVNGKVSLDWTDNDPVRFGPAYTSGKIGFRQMAGTVGKYRDFKVWALKKRTQ
jgi:hypothetical protein